MFWGNDRLEQALAWAAGERPGRAPAFDGDSLPQSARGR